MAVPISCLYPPTNFHPWMAPRHEQRWELVREVWSKEYLELPSISSCLLYCFSGLNSFTLIYLMLMLRCDSDLLWISLKPCLVALQCRLNWVFCNLSYACVKIIFINMFVLLRLWGDLFICYLKSIRKFSSPLRTLVTMVLLLVYSPLLLFLWLCLLL